MHSAKAEISAIWHSCPCTAAHVTRVGCPTRTKRERRGVQARSQRPAMNVDMAIPPSRWRATVLIDAGSLHAWRAVRPHLRKCEVFVPDDVEHDTLGKHADQTTSVTSVHCSVLCRLCSRHGLSVRPYLALMRIMIITMETQLRFSTSRASCSWCAVRSRALNGYFSASEGT